MRIPVEFEKPAAPLVRYPVGLIVAGLLIVIACGLTRASLHSVAIALAGVAGLMAAAYVHARAQLATVPVSSRPQVVTVRPFTAPILARLEAGAGQQARTAVTGLFALAVFSASLLGLASLLRTVSATASDIAGAMAIGAISLALAQALPAYPFDGGYLWEAAWRCTAARPLAVELVGAAGYALALVVGLYAVLSEPALILLGAFLWLTATERREAAWNAFRADWIAHECVTSSSGRSTEPFVLWRRTLIFEA